MELLLEPLDRPMETVPCPATAAWSALQNMSRLVYRVYMSTRSALHIQCDGNRCRCRWWSSQR